MYIIQAININTQVRHGIVPLFTVAADIKLLFSSSTVFSLIELKVNEFWRPIANWGKEPQHLLQQNGKKTVKNIQI